MGLLGSKVDEESNPSKLLDITFSAVVWYSLYKLLQQFLYNKTPEWSCRIVSLIHGLVVTVLSYYSQMVEGPCMLGIEPGLSNNHTQVLIVKICLGYFIYDISWCLYYQTEPAIMMFHHCLSIFGMVCTLFMSKWGTELVGVVALTEVSNPLLQIRWFLKDQGYSKTLVGEIVDFTFIAVFGIFRLGLGGYVLVGYTLYPNDDMLGRFGAVAIFAVSLVFYYYILGYAYKKYSRLYYSTFRPTSAAPACNGATSGSISNGLPHSNGHIKTS